MKREMPFPGPLLGESSFLNEGRELGSEAAFTVRITSVIFSRLGCVLWHFHACVKCGVNADSSQGGLTTGFATTLGPQPRR